MPFQTKLRALAVTAFALAFAQTSFGQVNSCANIGTPVDGYTNYSCNVYYNGSPDTLSLLSVMTQDGALLVNNDYTAQYDVIINGNPATLSDDSSGLFNESLWEAVLYFPGGDPDGADDSDTLEVFFPGDFPTASTVQNFNQAIFGSGVDADFFTQATGTETVVAGVFDVYTDPPAAAAPEPASFTLMATGVLGLGLLAAVKQRKHLFGQA